MRAAVLSEDKPAFRDAMRRRRCLFPADGFYEWKTEGGGRRPYFVRPRAGGPIAFAGLWDSWMGPNGEEMASACIVTTAANRMLAPLHDRMPVVVSPEAFEFWLYCAKIDASTAAALIMPAPDNFFDAYEVSTAVNHADNNSAALIEPLRTAGEPAPAQPEQGSGGDAPPAGGCRNRRRHEISPPRQSGRRTGPAVLIFTTVRLCWRGAPILPCAAGRNGLGARLVARVAALYPTLRSAAERGRGTAEGRARMENNGACIGR